MQLGRSGCRGLGLAFETRNQRHLAVELRAQAIGLACRGVVRRLELSGFSRQCLSLALQCRDVRRLSLQICASRGEFAIELGEGGVSFIDPASQLVACSAHLVSFALRDPQAGGPLGRLGFLAGPLPETAQEPADHTADQRCDEQTEQDLSYEICHDPSYCTLNSIRRLRARPLGVELSAIGCDSP